MLGVGLTVLAAAGFGEDGFGEDGFGEDGFGEDGVATLLAGGLAWVAFGCAGAVEGFWGWAVLVGAELLTGVVSTALGVAKGVSFLGSGWAVLAGLASFILGETGSFPTDGVDFWAGVEVVSGVISGVVVGAVGALVTEGSGFAFSGGTTVGFWGRGVVGGLLGAADGLGVSEGAGAGTSLISEAGSGPSCAKLGNATPPPKATANKVQYRGRVERLRMC
jgi:hypothetical protein